MKQDIEEKIKQIHEKLLQLNKQHAATIKENQQLKEALHASREAAGLAADNAVAMQQQLDIVKFGNAKMNIEEKKAFEKRINSYIKEIDKCISLLSI